MRFFSFTRSVIDWDESTYILIAKALLEGKTLYKDVWDTKPPGIFLLFAGIQYLFNDAVFATRIIGTGFVCGTAFLIYKICRFILPENPLQALFSGIFYISLISFNGFSFAISRGLGLEANTELFFIFFTVFGYYLFLTKNQHIIYLFLAGFSLGIAFIIKYFVAFDIVALGVIILIKNGILVKANFLNALKKTSYQTIFISIGVLLPFIISIVYFHVTTNLKNFWEVTFEVGKRYSTPFNLFKTLKFIGDYVYLIGIFSVCLVVVLFNLSKKNRLTHKALIFWICWLLFALIGACFSGKNFYHYLYPTFPALSLICAYIFAKNYFNNKNFQKKLQIGVTVILFLSIPIVGFLKIKTLFSTPDFPKIIGAYTKNEPIFVDNYFHIVHFYNNTLPLTPYYHPSLLYKNDHLNALNVSQEEEVKKIEIQQPTFIIYKKTPSSQFVQDVINKNYVEDKRFNNEIYLFKLKNYID